MTVAEARREAATEADLLAALKTKFAAPEWFLLTHVRDAAGFDAHRTADAIAMNLWPSRGLAIHGFEVKVSRADWRRELVNPDKAEAGLRFADFIWVVVSDLSIIEPGELPASWGQLVRTARGLKVQVQPAQRDAVPVGRSFVAAMFRRAEQVRADSAALKAEYDRGFEAGKKTKAEGDRYRRDRLEQIAANVEAFEQASGINISHGWDLPKIGEAVRTIRDAGVERVAADLKTKGERLIAAAAELNGASS